MNRRFNISEEEYDKYEYKDFRITLNVKGFVWWLIDIDEKEEGFGDIYDVENIATFLDGNNNIYCVPIDTESLNGAYTIGELAKLSEEGRLLGAKDIRKRAIEYAINARQKTENISKEQAIYSIKETLKQNGIEINIDEILRD